MYSGCMGDDGEFVEANGQAGDVPGFTVLGPRLAFEQ